MNRNIIEELIDTQAGAYRHERADADLRRRVQRRRVRNASLTGVGAVAAVGGVAVAGTSITGANRGFTPEAWAPAPNPYAADIDGDGVARVPLPTPPQVTLGEPVNADPTGQLGLDCAILEPTPTSQQGHAAVSLDAVQLMTEMRFSDATSSNPSDGSWTLGGLSEWTLSSTTGAPTSVRVSDTRLYFVLDGIVQEVWYSWQAAQPSEFPVTDGVDGPLLASAGRDLRHLGGDQLSSTATHMYVGGGLPCTQDTNVPGPLIRGGQEYQVYLEVRVVADEQSAAQLHLMDEGVDLDSVTGSNGTIIEIYNSGGTDTFEAIDVKFPASYLQDQFDEVLVSEPITVRIPDSWGY
jgi:hypothetical protein